LSAIIASITLFFTGKKCKPTAYALYKLNEKGLSLYYFLHNTIIHCNIVFLSFFFLICFFFQFKFNHLILGLLEFKLHNFFQLTFYKIISNSWHGPQVWLVDSSFFSFVIFFSTSSFNIRLIENWASSFVSFYFLWAYPHLITWVTGLTN